MRNTGEAGAGCFPVAVVAKVFTAHATVCVLVQRPRYEINHPFGMVPLRGRPLH